MSRDYHSTIVVYERGRGLASDRVRPVRVRKEWVEGRDGRRLFQTTRSQVLMWREVWSPLAGGDWTSIRVTAPTRDELLSHGALTEVGHGLPCLHHMLSVGCSGARGHAAAGPAESGDPPTVG